MQNRFAWEAPFPVPYPRAVRAVAGVSIIIFAYSLGVGRSRLHDEFVHTRVLEGINLDEGRQP